MKKFIFYLLSVFIFFFLANTASANYDRQITYVNVCHTGITPKFTSRLTTYTGNYQIRFLVKNNGNEVSPATRVAFDLGSRLGSYGYPSTTSCNLPAINPGATIYTRCDKNLTYSNGNRAWLDGGDSNNANNTYYGAYWMSPCW